MSNNSVDNRVVQMKFDNASFEKNVQTSMNTLNKLNKSLDLTESAKGLQGISAAASKIDLSGIQNGAEALRMKFSALQVMAVTALANITNSALNAGKRIASALTIDPIKTGFQEYETQINAVQTILANTESKGTTLQNVNNALAELNLYADKTIYNFTEMTRNIGTFTAAGVDLDKSVSAIKGIANLAAVSGSNSQQASTAMYQLSQALASGTVKLMDWNSVVNAGMGGQVFQDSLKETARVHGVAIDSMIKNEGSFRETLQNGWLTSDILTETLSKFTGDLNEKQLKTMGYSDDQIVSILKLGQTANDAATKVKTFTQLFDTLKEAAQSGWTQSWQIIVGDFGEAKELLTEMSNTFGNIIGGMANSRNDLLLGGLGSGWKQLLGQGVSDAAGYEEEIAKVAKAHGVDLKAMVTDEFSFQDALQKTIKDGKVGSFTLSEALNNLTAKTAGLSDEKLKDLGYTREQIKDLAKLNANVKNGTVNLQEFADKIARTSGRENLIEALRNSLNGILGVIKPVSEAFREIFPPMTAKQLYALTEKIKELTESFKMTDETTKNLKNTFKGIFAVIDIVGQALKAIFQAVVPLFDGFSDASGGVLALTGSFGEWLVKLDESIKKAGFFTNVVKKVTDGIKSGFTMAEDGITSFLTKFLEFIGIGTKDLGFPSIKGFNEVLQRVHERMASVTKSAETLREALSNAFQLMMKSASFAGFMSAMEKLADFLQSIWNVVKMVGKGITDAVGQFTSGFVKSLGDANFNAIFDVINGGLIATLLAGITKFVFGLGKILNKVGDSIGTFAEIKEAVLDTFGAFQQQLKAKTLLNIAAAIALLTASLVVLSMIDSEKLSVALVAITGLFTDLMGSMAIFTKISGSGLKSVVKLTTVMLAMSASILILAIAMKTISSLDWEGIAKGLVSVGALTAMLVATAVVLSKSSGKMMKGMTSLLIFTFAIRNLVDVVKELGSLDSEVLLKGLIGVGVVIAELAAFMTAANYGKMGITTGIGLIALAGAINILASSVQIFGMMDTTALIQGLVAMQAVLTELSLFIQINKNSGGMIGVATGMIILGAAMMILAKAVGQFGSMPLESMIQGLAGMAGVLTSLTIALNLMPKNMIGIGAGLVAVGLALILMANALSTMGSMSWEEIAKGMIALAGGLAAVALAANAMTGAIAGAAAMLVMAAALAIFAPTLVLLSTMSWEEIGKGLIALAGAFLVLGVAGAVLGPLVPAILGLAASFALIGVGVAAVGLGLLAAGAGLAALAAGFAMLATLGSAGAVAVVAALVIIIEGVASMIPVVLEKIGEGIIALAQVIIDSAPVIVDAMVTVITAVVSGLVAVIPIVVDGIFMLLTAVLESLVKYGPTIIQAVVDIIFTLITTVLNAIVTYGPQIIQAALDIMLMFMQELAAALPEIVQAGIDIILGFIQGLTTKLPDIIQTGVDFIVAFINGVASASVQLVEAAFQAMITFINGLSVCIDQNAPILIAAIQRLMLSILRAAVTVLTSGISLLQNKGREIMEALIKGIKEKIEDVKSTIKDVISKAVSAIKDKLKDFKDAGKNLVDGMVEGIKERMQHAIDEAKEIGRSILKAIKEVLGIASPSKEFANVGRYAMIGLIQGLHQYASDVYSTTTNIGNGALDAMQESINGISKIVNDKFNCNPVIRPTLDLTNLTNGVKDINSMFNNQKIRAYGQNGQNDGNNGRFGTNYNFTQNNYSPKALSAVEIYRQTKNQFSTLKGVVNNI